VTKKDIVKAISDQIGLTQLKTKEIVQKTFDAIIDTLVREERIELRNFGVFEVKKRAARKARNPRTGERVDVAEKYVVTFKPGKEMEERVKQLEIANAQAQAAAQATAPESTPGSSGLLSGSSPYNSPPASSTPQPQPPQTFPSNSTNDVNPISPPPGPNPGTGY
jgi:integration host factor subunit beta